MTARFAAWLRRQPVFAFYLLAFAITWLAWLPQAAHSRGLFPFDNPLFYILGGIGPMVAAFVVLRALKKDAVKELFGPLLRWRVGTLWYAVALCGYPAIWLAAVAISGDPGRALEAVGPSLALLSLFFISLVAAVPEEVAWRGFALPRLQARYSALVSSLIVGVLWALWHLPLLLNADNVMSTYPLLPFFVAVLARAVLYSWLYNSTGGSVLIVTIFHAVSNTGFTFVPAEVLVSVVLVAIIVIAFGPARLSHQSERVVQAGERRAVGGT
jgi:uncharacterized protein